MNKIIKLFGISAAVSFLPIQVAEAAWPEKPITVVVPYRAGGITDLTARWLEPALEEVIKQEVVVFNISGHSSVGTRRVIDAEPNGYEFLWTETGIITTQASGVADFGYRDLKPVAAVSNICSVIMMRNKEGMEDVSDLFTQAKKEDRALTAGVTLGGLSHMSILALANASNTNVRFAQVGGSADTYAALLGDHIDISWATPGTAMKYTRDESGQFMDEVQVKAGLYLGSERFPGLPEVPTAHDIGLDVEVCMPHVLFAPQNTPDEIVNKMALAIEKAYEDQNVQKAMEEFGATHFFMSGEKLQDYLSSQWELLAPLARQATKE